MCDKNEKYEGIDKNLVNMGWRLRGVLGALVECIVISDNEFCVGIMFTRKEHMT